MYCVYAWKWFVILFDNHIDLFQETLSIFNQRKIPDRMITQFPVKINNFALYHWFYKVFNDIWVILYLRLQDLVIFFYYQSFLQKNCHVLFINDWAMHLTRSGKSWKIYIPYISHLQFLSLYWFPKVHTYDTIDSTKYNQESYVIFNLSAVYISIVESQFGDRPSNRISLSVFWETWGL